MLLLPTQRKAVAFFCQGNNIIISWRCYILFLVVWRCQKCIWKLLWTALYLFNALLKDGKRSNTLTQLSLHYIKSSENHGTQMFFIKLNLTPLYLTMTYPGKSISSVYVLARKKEKCIKKTRNWVCCIFTVDHWPGFCDSSYPGQAKQQNTQCLNLIFSKSKMWNILLILQNLLKCKNKF